MCRRQRHIPGFLVRFGFDTAENLADDEVGYCAGRHALRRLVEIFRDLAVFHQHLRILFGDAPLAGVPCHTRIRQLGQLGAQRLDLLVRSSDGHQIGVLEIAIIVRVLFGAHAFGHTGFLVIPAGFLHHRFAAFDQIDLAVKFVRHRFGDMSERVHVFDLGAGAELVGADRPHRNVDIAAHGTFLHPAIRHPNGAHQQLQFFHVLANFVHAAEIRLGHDLNQRHTAAVVVHKGVAVAVHQLARILFDMDVVQPDAATGGQLHIAFHTQRVVQLGDLIRLRQIGIHIVFAIHLGDMADAAVGDQPRFDGITHHLMIQLGQCAGQADADGAAVGVGFAAEFGGAAAENLGFGGQLDMGFQTGNQFVFSHSDTPPSTGRRFAAPDCSY